MNRQTCPFPHVGNSHVNPNRDTSPTLQLSRTVVGRYVRLILKIPNSHAHFSQVLDQRDVDSRHWNMQFQHLKIPIWKRAFSYFFLLYTPNPFVFHGFNSKCHQENDSPVVNSFKAWIAWWRSQSDFQFNWWLMPSNATDWEDIQLFLTIRIFYSLYKESVW